MLQFNLPIPRPFQQYALDELTKSTSNRILLNAPTGSGKALLFMMIAAKALNEGKKVALLVDRSALLIQLSATADQCNIPHSIIGGTAVSKIIKEIRKDKIENNNFVVATVQSFFNRLLSHYDLLLIDEAHTQYTLLRGYLYGMFKGVAIGATATPYTTGLDHTFKTLINCSSVHALTSTNILVPIEPIICKKIDMSQANTAQKEWGARDVHCNSIPIYKEIVNSYKKHADGLPALVFCANINHCVELCNLFAENGIVGAVFSSKTTEDGRLKILEGFDNGKIKMLFTVAALSKGFDRSYVQCIIDVRPLRSSFSEYVQILGRGLRADKNKTKCILLDFTGNFYRFLPDFERVYYNGVIDFCKAYKFNRIRKPMKKLKIATCKECGFKHVANQCLRCGANWKEDNMIWVIFRRLIGILGYTP